MAGFVGVVVIAVVAAALLAGGGSESATDPDAPTSPGTSPPSAEDRSEAEDAVRQTVEAYAAAEGEQETCRLLTPDERNTYCPSYYETAQPVRYDIPRVSVADDQATVDARQAEFDDPIELELVRQGQTWLIDESSSFEWKDAEEVEVATAVHRFGRREGDYCGLLAAALLQEVGGPAGCERRYPSDQPARYDITRIAGVAGVNLSVTAQVGATQVDGYNLLEEGGEWRINSIT